MQEVSPAVENDSAFQLKFELSRQGAPRFIGLNLLVERQNATVPAESDHQLMLYGRVKAAWPTSFNGTANFTLNV